MVATLHVKQAAVNYYLYSLFRPIILGLTKGKQESLANANVKRATAVYV